MKWRDYEGRVSFELLSHHLPVGSVITTKYLRKLVSKLVFEPGAFQI